MSFTQLVTREKATTCFTCFNVFISILACYYNTLCHFCDVDK